jgi:hypothetical protein
MQRILGESSCTNEEPHSAKVLGKAVGARSQRSNALESVCTIACKMESCWNHIERLTKFGVGTTCPASGMLIISRRKRRIETVREANKK